MDDWEKFNEPTLLQKEEFHSHLSKKDITDADSPQAKKFVMILKILRFEYNDLYVQSDTLLLADVFNNFQNIGLILLSFFLCQD